MTIFVKKRLVKVMPNKYAKDTKKFTFYAKDTLHADFKIRMQYHICVVSKIVQESENKIEFK